MWEATVLVEREQLVDVPPEKVWELAGSPGAFSVVPGWFAFSVPGVPEGADRLCCLLVAGRGSVRRPVVDARTIRCTVVDVREEIAGQRISGQVRSTKPAGRQVFTLSVRSRTGGSAVRVTVSDVVSRPGLADRQVYWRRHLRAWLERLRAAAEERAPWPQAGMPAAMQRALAAPAPLRDPMEVSAAVVVDGAPDAVWQAVSDPASGCLGDPERIAWSGHVPGTPQRAAGEMQYYVHRHPGGRFTASVHAVTELADGHRMVTRHIGRPDYEAVSIITAVPAGTRLELAGRWPASAARGQAGAREVIRAGLQRSAEAHQALVEGTPGSGG